MAVEERAVHVDGLVECVAPRLVQEEHEREVAARGRHFAYPGGGRDAPAVEQDPLIVAGDPAHVDAQHPGRLDQGQPRQQPRHATDRLVRCTRLDARQRRVRLVGADGDQRSVGRPRESWPRESDGGERRRGRRPARGCQAQTHVLTEQCSRREQDAFHGPYLSAKIPEAAFHGQAVKTVASLRVSTAHRTCAASASPSSSTHATTTSASTRSSRRPPLDRLPTSAAGLDELMHLLQRGDRLVVSELSRLGRSRGQIVAILDALAKADVAWRSRSTFASRARATSRPRS